VKTRYASLGGAPNRHQSDLLAVAIAQLPPGGVVVAATDNDQAGHAYAHGIALLCYARDLLVTFERHVPTIGKDWNDHLTVQRGAEVKHSPLGPARSDRGGPER
jgi:hypothetical protein